MKRMLFSNESLPIASTLNGILNVKKGGIDLQPKYQRGYIWINEFKDRLIYSIIMNYPIGNISLRVLENSNSKGARREVVDGQQRLQTIFDFVNGEYSIHSETANDIIDYIVVYMEGQKDVALEKLKKKKAKSGKTVLKYVELPDEIKRNFDSFNLAITNISNVTEEEISYYFRYLQNQERLRAGEIINAIPESVLEKYMPDKNITTMFLKKLSFSNQRKHFDRIFYANLGLIDGKVGFGTMDKVILNYVASGVDLSEDAKIKCNLMINQISIITACASVPVGFTKANARLIKFILLLMAQGYVDFSTDTKEKLSSLIEIDEKLSRFSSAKANSISSAFSDYSQAVIEEYRLIALIAKGGHSFRRVDNRMKILAFYVNNRGSKTQTSGIIPE